MKMYLKRIVNLLIVILSSCQEVPYSLNELEKEFKTGNYNLVETKTNEILNHGKADFKIIRLNALAIYYQGKFDSALVIMERALQVQDDSLLLLSRAKIFE